VAESTRKGGKRKPSDPFKGIKPVGKPRSLGEAVYETLKTAIVKGDLRPGQRLVEQQLSNRLQTSRIPIREAIKTLEQEDLVEKMAKKGWVVRSITKEEIEETFGIRAVLESYAAYLATERVTDALIARLESAIGAYREALTHRDTEALMSANTQFHEMIYKASGSQKLYSLINNFRDFISRYRRALLTNLDFAKISLEDHVQMVSAMRKKDKEKVESLVRAHILRGKGIVVTEMEQGRLV
jgi:DNA-binding GntR family transcriptional regulator